MQIPKNINSYSIMVIHNLCFIFELKVNVFFQTDHVAKAITVNTHIRPHILFSLLELQL